MGGGKRPHVGACEPWISMGLKSSERQRPLLDQASLNAIA